MAQVKIYDIEEQLYPKRRLLSDVIHSCVMDALGMPEDKRAHRYATDAPGLGVSRLFDVLGDPVTVYE